MRLNTKIGDAGARFLQIMKRIISVLDRMLLSFAAVTYSQSRQMAVRMERGASVALVIGNAAYEMSPLTNPVTTLVTLPAPCERSVSK